MQHETIPQTDALAVGGVAVGCGLRRDCFPLTAGGRARLHPPPPVGRRPRGGGGGGDKGSVSVPVGTSGCTHWFEFSGGSCLHCVSQVTGGTIFFLGEWGNCLLPLGAPPMPAPVCFTKSFPGRGCSPAPM